MSVGKRIAQRRKKMRMSQESLAELIGTHQRQISRYETGENDPTGDVLVKLARALNTTTDWILGLTDIPNRPLRSSLDLSEDEIELIDIYRHKMPEAQRKALDVLRVL